MQVAPRRGEQGVAMILALIALVVVAGIGMLMFTRSINEIRHSSDDTAIVQSLMLARGGANVGAVLMGTEVSDYLHDVVEATSRPGRWAYGVDLSPRTDAGPDPVSVVSAMDGMARDMQTVVDDLVCGKSVMDADNAEVLLRIHFTDTACGVALPASITLADGRFVEGIPRGGSLDGIQTYALPVVMVSEAVMGDFRRNIVIQGEYVFDVGQTSFAHYAYFTNRESDSGGRIWFTDETIIDGPTHTNSNFSFYRNPWFGGRVSSAGCQDKACQGNRSPGAYFYNSSSQITAPGSMRPNMSRPKSGENEPEFSAGVQWNGAIVELPTSAYSQEQVAEGIDRPDDIGLKFEGSLDHLTLWAGDSNGNELNASGNGWTDASWQYIQATVYEEQWVVVREAGRYRVCYWWGCQYENLPTKYAWVDVPVSQTWRFNETGLFQQLREDGDMTEASDWLSQPQGKAFNGVIYVDGRIERLHGPERSNSSDPNTASPAIAEFAQITVASSGDIRLTSDLKYEEPPCIGRPTRDRRDNVITADCSNLEHDNVLGVYSQGGDIIVGNDHGHDSDLNAPYDVNVHGVLMSGTGQIRVEGYVKQFGDGSFDSDRGSFFLLGGMIQENRGVFGTFGGSGRKGYDRVYTYDPRMMRGMAPPFFPTTGLGEVTFAAFFSFGQREQLY